MTAAGEHKIINVADAPWPDVVTVFGTRGDSARCWCQFFKSSKVVWDADSVTEFRDELRLQVAEPPSPGVIVYENGEPVGWCAVEPRTQYPRLQQSTIVREGSAEMVEDASVWAVTCFVVRVGHRRRGIGGALLRGAVEQARSLGARVLEGYPVDVTAKAKVSAAELYHGSVTLFEAAEFEVVSRPSSGRAVVRLDLL